MTCHHTQEPFPYALEKWSQWANPTKRDDEAFLNRFTELNGRLAVVRANIKRKRIRDPKQIIGLLYPIDCMLEDWSNNLPESWKFKSYRRIFEKQTNLEVAYDGQYGTYRDIWVASTWNNYRMIRIIIHETIMVAAMKYGSDDDRKESRRSAEKLAMLANDICHSVPYFLGYQGPESVFTFKLTMQDEDRGGMRPNPGGYLLLWPLFHAGSSTAIARSQKCWIVSVLRYIGSYMGTQLATSMAMRLEEEFVSYPENMTWLFGEFHPS